MRAGLLKDKFKSENKLQNSSQSFGKEKENYRYIYNPTAVNLIDWFYVLTVNIIAKLTNKSFEAAYSDNRIIKFLIEN